MAQSARPVPDELMSQLHDATERFHQRRRELEHWMDSSEFRHQERVAAAEEQLRQAEREIERLEQKIKEILSGEPPQLPSEYFID